MLTRDLEAYLLCTGGHHLHRGQPHGWISQARTRTESWDPESQSSVSKGRAVRGSTGLDARFLGRSFEHRGFYLLLVTVTPSEESTQIFNEHRMCLVLL
jgi:hypothetical protein